MEFASTSSIPGDPRSSELVISTQSMIYFTLLIFGHLPIIQQSAEQAQPRSGPLAPGTARRHRYWKVLRGMPRRADASDWFPPARSRAHRRSRRSVSPRTSSRRTGPSGIAGHAGPWAGGFRWTSRGRCEERISEPPQRAKAAWTACSSSRTFPGQPWIRSARRVSS
jgi:hypothetical protein